MNNKFQLKTYPIRSGQGYDFGFMAPILEHKKVVLLGESTHCSAEYFLSKATLVKYLNQELGFEYLVLEASMGDCLFTQQQINQMSEEEALKNTMYPFMHFKEANPLFELVKQNKIKLLGYDLFSAGTFGEWLSQLFQGKTAYDYQQLELAFYDIQMQSMTQPDFVFTDTSKVELIQAYQWALQHLHLISLGQTGDQVLRKALQNRVDYIRLSTGNPYQDHHVRELILAENILWISQTLIPEQKIVVWTHNTHVQKSYSQNPVSVAGQVLMGKGAGEIIHNVNPDQVYAIGLYAGSGSVWRFWDQQHLEIGPLDSTYLEHQLLDHGKDLFINLNQTDQGANDHWIFSPVNSLNYGYETVRLNLRDNYDGLLFIHQVSVAQWLDQLYNDGG